VGQSSPAASSTLPLSTASGSISGAVENNVVQYGYFTGRKMLARQAETLSPANQVAPSSSSNKQAELGAWLRPRQCLPISTSSNPALNCA
jgi:hypothetical protein